jgi:SAM-dependent methyltransferase
MSQLLVNLGCGNVWHGAWQNLDLSPGAPGIGRLDLGKPLPFADVSVDALYHSHVLEHLSREQAQQLIAECARVLRPGGILRVVVPDLETAARLYLEKLSATAAGGAALEYEWALIQLLDQMVRTRPWGEAGDFLRRPEARANAFVRTTAGTATLAHFTPGEISPPRNFWSRLRHHRPVLFWRRKWRETRLALARLFLTPSEKTAFTEALFRAEGELHRWMYDRVSLRRLLQERGLIEVAQVTAHESRIEGFAAFRLDVTEANEVRRPDSIFVEAVKPTA